MPNIEHGETRKGRGFPVEEAARLLAAGVYLPDYPEALIAEAWRLNYVGAVDDLRELCEALEAVQIVGGRRAGKTRIARAWERARLRLDGGQ